MCEWYSLVVLRMIRACSCSAASAVDLAAQLHPQMLPLPSRCRLVGISGSTNSIDQTRNCPPIRCFSDENPSSPPLQPSSPAGLMARAAATATAPLLTKKKRYRKLCPGESDGITEEMRFVAMKLRNTRGKAVQDGDGEECWQPTIDGFLKYLVDSNVIFSTVERIVGESDNVAYVYFRKTGLERSQGLTKDLEWFTQQDIVLPQPSPPGVSYAKYLKELAENSTPLFLSHFYNIYFSHISGGQVIAKKVSKMLLNGRELEFYRWDGDAQELLKGVREKLNMLGEHWSRNEKNKCLREASKSFQYMGQIVRLIIL